jgi:hypothetical protein
MPYDFFQLRQSMRIDAIVSPFVCIAFRRQQRILTRRYYPLEGGCHRENCSTQRRCAVVFLHAFLISSMEAVNMPFPLQTIGKADTKLAEP